MDSVEGTTMAAATPMEYRYDPGFSVSQTPS